MGSTLWSIRGRTTDGGSLECQVETWRMSCSPLPRIISRSICVQLVTFNNSVYVLALPGRTKQRTDKR